MILHFSSSLENIVSILNSKCFRLSYCTEYFGIGESQVSNAAHPMVCFSEYTEVDLRSKYITYGGYAIALTKVWARSKGLNPVLYVERDSQVANGIGTLLKARKKRGREAVPKRLRLPIMQVKCFTKHEIGYNSYLRQRNYCFKDENEWRYVPTKEKIGGGYISLNYSTFVRDKAKYNSRLSDYSLKFAISDVEAIYVRDEQEGSDILQVANLPTSRVKLSTWAFDK